MSGLKKRVEYLIKHSPLIQVLYRKGMSFAFQTLGLFVRRDEKLILLSASGGRKYGDSPRILFEAIDYSCLDGIIDRSKFNVVYAGNIGVMQNVEIVIRAAAQMKDDKDVCFHVIGDGAFQRWQVFLHR